MYSIMLCEFPGVWLPHVVDYLSCLGTNKTKLDFTNM